MKFSVLLLAMVLPVLPSLLAGPPEPRAPQPGADDAPLPAGAVARFGTARWRTSTEGRTLTLSPDGAVVLVATDALSIDRLDAKTGRRLPTVGIPTATWGVDMTPPVAFSADGKLLATSSVDQGDDGKPHLSVRRWADDHEVRGMSFVRKRGYEPTVPALGRVKNSSSTAYEHLTAVAFSPDGKTLAAAARYYFVCTTRVDGADRQLHEEDDNVVQLWDLASGEKLREQAGHTKAIHTVVFSADGKGLTTASQDGTARFWDAGTGRERGKPWEAGGPTYAAAYSPDRKLFAAGGAKIVLVWDTATGALRHRLELPAAEARSVAFAPDGRTLAAAGGDVIRFWSVGGQPLGDVRPAARLVRSVVFAADGQTLFSTHAGEHRVRRWDVRTRRSVPEPDGFSEPVRLLAFTPDGGRVLASSAGDEPRSWDPATGRAEVLGSNAPGLTTALVASSGRTTPVLCADAFASGFALALGKGNRLDQVPGLLGCSTDGKRLLRAGEKDGKLMLTVSDPVDNRAVREIACAAGEATSAALSPDGRTVATAADGVLGLIDVATGTRRRYPVATQPAKTPVESGAVKFAPDGTRVVVLGDRDVLRVVSTADGRLVSEIDTREKQITGVAFSPDGKTLVSAALFGNVAVWEVSSGRQLREGPAGIYLFGAGNRALATLTADGLRLCDLYSGAVWRECRVTGAEPGSFTFSPDGRRLAAGYSDCTVVLWTVPGPATPGGAAKPGAKQFGECWADLEGADAARAYAAIGGLVDYPEDALRFLGQRLRAAEAGPPAQQGTLPPDELAHDRAVQVLERIGTANARRLLDRLAAGAAGAARTAAARDALRRLAAHDKK